MMASMNAAQIDALLRQQVVARIGCAAKGRPYVVPVFYAYAEGSIYCQSREGLKLNILRENPHACVQIDAIDNLSNWRSVVIRGRFKELKSVVSIKKAATVLDAKFFPLATGEQVTHMPAAVNAPEVVEKKRRAIYFQISIDDVSGRFEKN